MTPLESKLRALVAEWPHDEDIYTCGALGGQQKSTSHRADCRKCAIEALLTERQPAPLSAEQVALAIAANKLLPDPPGGYDMEGIVRSLNGLLASASALAERQEPPAPLDCGCVPAQISPSCTKGHVSGAFVLKARERPSFSVDLEDYQ